MRRADTPRTNTHNARKALAYTADVKDSTPIRPGSLRFPPQSRILPRPRPPRDLNPSARSVLGAAGPVRARSLPPLRTSRPPPSPQPTPLCARPILSGRRRRERTFRSATAFSSRPLGTDLSDLEDIAVLGAHVRPRSLTAPPTRPPAGRPNPTTSRRARRSRLSSGKRAFSGHCGIHSEALLPSDSGESTPTGLCTRHAPKLLRRLAA